MIVFEIDNGKMKERFSTEEIELVYDSLIQMGFIDDENDNVSSKIMNKLYNLLENV
jgi:hypothetical protein